MLRERLKEMELHITELADYLQVSRPTMYKFIDYYDCAKYNLINKNVLSLFNYIEENELAGKKNVINFILNNLVYVKETKDEYTAIIGNIKNVLRANPDSKKSKFITDCLFADEFSDIIYFLADIASIIKKKRPSADEKQKLHSYSEIKNKIKPKEEN